MSNDTTRGVIDTTQIKPDPTPLDDDIAKVETRIDRYQSDAIEALQEARNVLRAELGQARQRRDALREQGNRLASLADSLEEKLDEVENVIDGLGWLCEKGDPEA